MINTKQANSRAYYIAVCVFHFHIFAHANIYALIASEPSFKMQNLWWNARIVTEGCATQEQEGELGFKENALGSNKLVSVSKTFFTISYDTHYTGHNRC